MNETHIDLPCVVYSPSDMDNLHNRDAGVQVTTLSGDPIVTFQAVLTNMRKHLGFLTLPRSALFTATFSGQKELPAFSITLDIGFTLEDEKTTPYHLLNSTGAQDSKLFFTKNSAELLSIDDTPIGAIEWDSDWGSLNRPRFYDPDHEHFAKMVKCEDKPFKKKYPYQFNQIEGERDHVSLDARLIFAWILWKHIRQGDSV